MTAGMYCERRRPRKLGVVPKDAVTKRPDEIPAWDDMPAELQPVLARQMEIYAGFLEQTDHEVGRVVDAIDDLGVLDDTLIYYIIGDNGASAEGMLNGCFNELTTLNGLPGIETTEFLLSKIDDFGAPAATTITRSAGRTPSARLTVDESKSRPTGAAPATAQSCTGPTALPRGRYARPVPSCDRRGADHPRNRGAACARIRQWHHAGTAGRRSMMSTLRDAKAPETPGAVLRDVGQPAASTSRAGPLSRSTGPRGKRIHHRHSTPTCGSCTGRTTGPKPTTWRRRTRRNSLSCNGFGSSKR